MGLLFSVVKMDQSFVHSLLLTRTPTEVVRLALRHYQAHDARGGKTERHRFSGQNVTELSLIPRLFAINIIRTRDAASSNIRWTSSLSRQRGQAARSQG